MFGWSGSMTPGSWRIWNRQECSKEGLLKHVTLSPCFGMLAREMCFNDNTMPPELRGSKCPDLDASLRGEVELGKALFYELRKSSILDDLYFFPDSPRDRKGKEDFD